LTNDINYLFQYLKVIKKNQINEKKFRKIKT